MTEQVAERVWRIPLAPLDAINCYLLDDVLVDAGVRFSGARIRRALQGRRLAAHALTHVHPDHQGASKQVCEKFRVPLWCGAGDAEVMESGQMQRQFPHPGGPIARFQSRFVAGPSYPVTRTLTEGDRIGEFIVLETPGHTPGHVAFWRPSDRCLLIGDVAFGMNPFTMMRGLRQPPRMFTPDPERNRASLRKLAVLGPHTVCFGHGPVLRDGATFQRFVAQVAPAASGAG